LAAGQTGTRPFAACFRRAKVHDNSKTHNKRPHTFGGTTVCLV
jgi:hypothetical protein